MSNNYTAVLEQARNQFSQRNSMEMARLSGVAFSYFQTISLREYTVPYLGRIYRVLWPAGEVLQYANNKEAPTAIQIIILHYLTNAPGKMPEGRWVPFRQLWGGNSFNLAFKKRALSPLTEFFGSREKMLLNLLAERLQARPAKEPQSYVIMALPRLPLLIRFEPGDKEVPPRAILLFDSVSNKYLVTEDLAVLGETLTVRLIQWGKQVLQKQSKTTPFG